MRDRAPILLILFFIKVEQEQWKREAHGPLPCPVCPLRSRWCGTCCQEHHRRQTFHQGCAGHLPAGKRAVSKSICMAPGVQGIELLVLLHKHFIQCERRPRYKQPLSPALFSSDLDQEITDLKGTQDLTHNFQALCVRNHGVKLPSNVKVLQEEGSPKAVRVFSPRVFGPSWKSRSTSLSGGLS